MALNLPDEWGVKKPWPPKYSPEDMQPTATQEELDNLDWMYVSFSHYATFVVDIFKKHFIQSWKKYFRCRVVGKFLYIKFKSEDDFDFDSDYYAVNLDSTNVLFRFNVLKNKWEKT